MNCAAIVQHYRRWRLARQGLHLDRSCHVDRLVSTAPWGSVPGKVTVGPECQLSFGVELNPWQGFITIGRDVFLGPHTVIYGQGGVEIGDHSLISMHCCIVSSNHSAAARGEIIRHKPDILRPTKIGRDVWLGAGVKVLGGVTIGDGCVVGAGAVVTKNLPANSIAMGVPARVVGTRE